MHFYQVALVACLHDQRNYLELHFHFSQLPVLYETTEMPDVCRLLDILTVEVPRYQLLDVSLLSLRRTIENVAEGCSAVCDLSFLVDDAVDRGRPQPLRRNRSDEYVLIVGGKAGPLELKLEGEDVAITIFAEE